jgi:phospholipid/cholesterol/gamma-HCH transport system substrate-binding protein
METRANYALIGAFTLAVMAAAFAFVYWFSGGADKRSMRKSYRIVFTGSVSGLSRGSSVLFNGLRVGEVTEIDLMAEDPSRVAAVVEVNNRTPVKTDTKARLEFTGLTGVASIALTGGSASAEPLEAPAGERPVIYAEPSQLQDLLESVQRLASKSDGFLDRADKLLADNADSIHATVGNIEIFTKALADNSGNISEFLANMGEVGKAIGPLAKQLNVLSGDIDGLVKAVDPDKIRNIVGNADTLVAASSKLVTDNSQSLQATVRNAETFSKTLAANADKINQFLADMSDVGKAAGPLAKRLDGLAADTDQVVKSIDPARIKDILANVNTFTAVIAKNDQAIGGLLNDGAVLAKRLSETSVKLDGLIGDADGIAKAVDTNKLAQTLDGINGFASVLGQNRGNVDRILKDAAEIAAKFNNSADKIDGLLTSVQNLLGPGGGSTDAKGMFSDVAEAARSIKKLADSLDQRTREITAGINRLTGPTAREYDALAADARRSLNELNRVVRSIQQNPQQFIFGAKPAIPEYAPH